MTTAPRKPRPCPVCKTIGPPGYYNAHQGFCTPGLRALVRAAEAWERFIVPFYEREQTLRLAVIRFRKERERGKD